MKESLTIVTNEDHIVIYERATKENDTVTYDRIINEDDSCNYIWLQTNIGISILANRSGYPLHISKKSYIFVTQSATPSSDIHTEHVSQQFIRHYTVQHPFPHRFSPSPSRTKGIIRHSGRTSSCLPRPNVNTWQALLAPHFSPHNVQLDAPKDARRSLLSRAVSADGA